VGSLVFFDVNLDSFCRADKRLANGTFLGQSVCDDCGLTFILIVEFQSVFLRGPEAVQSFCTTLPSDGLMFEDDPSAENSCDSFQVNSGFAVLDDSVENVDIASGLSSDKGS
jgi:hypothetical protein